MANTKSAKKAIRSSARKAKINTLISKNYKEARKAVVDAVKAGKKKEANELVPAAIKAIDKAAKKSVIHKNTASRYKSRLAKAINSL